MRHPEFVRGRLDGLSDEPRAGRPRVIDHAQIVAATLEDSELDRAAAAFGSEARPRGEVDATAG